MRKKSAQCAKLGNAREEKKPANRQGISLRLCLCSVLRRDHAMHHFEMALQVAQLHGRARHLGLLAQQALQSREIGHCYTQHLKVGPLGTHVKMLGHVADVLAQLKLVAEELGILLALLADTLRKRENNEISPNLPVFFPLPYGQALADSAGRVLVARVIGTSQVGCPPCMHLTKSGGMSKSLPHLSN